MRRKVLVTETINHDTGEVIQSSETYLSKKNDERFTMNRTSDGLAWVKRISSGEWRVIMILLEQADSMTQRVQMTKGLREHVCNLLGITRQTLYNTTLKLEKNDFLRKDTATDYTINPQYFFKGGTGNIKEKINLYRQPNATIKS